MVEFGVVGGAWSPGRVKGEFAATLTDSPSSFFRGLLGGGMGWRTGLVFERGFVDFFIGVRRNLSLGGFSLIGGFGTGGMI